MELLSKLRLLGVLLILAIGVGLGLGLHSHDEEPISPPPMPPWGPAAVPPSPPSHPPPAPSCGQAVGMLSDVIGWTYFAAWSVSFWPQLIYNWERRSVVGLSFDFVLLNFCGFGCYSAYNIGLYYVPVVQQEYMEANGGHSSSVRVNDVFFALHAMAACAIGLLQIACYDRGRQRFSVWCLASVALFLFGVAVGVALIVARAAPWCTWFHFLYALSFVKLGISIVKYVPQVLLNARRRSTEGWSIDNVLLDFSGGALSLTQQMIDCACAADWGGISGDPVKFGLGFASMVFDVVFMMQHYVCFRVSSTQTSGFLSEVSPPLLLCETSSPQVPMPQRDAINGAASSDEVSCKDS